MPAEPPATSSPTPDPMPDPTPRPAPLPGPLGRLGARFYARTIAARNARFDLGRRVERLDRPVISIGNLSVGGTGKSPMVAWVVGVLREAGHDPCIAMRGYGAKPGRSDEAAEHAARFDDLPIVAQPDRAAGLRALFATPRGARVDVVVLDDGFQHRRLARQLDMVLIDSTHDPFDDSLLPAGWLREPVESLARATHVVLTHAESAEPGRVEALRAHLRTSGVEPAAVARHEWTELTMWKREGGLWAARAQPVEWLRGRRVVAACAIGNPQPFLRAVAAACGQETRAVVLRDHHPLDARTVRGLAARARGVEAEALVVTAKDWVKLRPHALELPVVVPELAVQLDSDALLRADLVDAARQW